MSYAVSTLTLSPYSTPGSTAHHITTPCLALEYNFTPCYFTRAQNLFEAACTKRAGFRTAQVGRSMMTIYRFPPATARKIT